MPKRWFSSRKRHSTSIVSIFSTPGNRRVTHWRGRRMLQRGRRSSAVFAVVTCVGCVGLLTVLGGLGHVHDPGGHVLLGDREVQAGDAELAADSRDNVFSSRYGGGKLAATRAALPGTLFLKRSRRRMES